MSGVDSAVRDVCPKGFPGSPRSRDPAASRRRRYGNCSLTVEERRAIAHGGTIPPRVEAMMKAEGEAAKTQIKQNSRNDSGTAGPASAGGWRLVNGQWVQAGARGNPAMAGGDRSNARIDSRDVGNTYAGGAATTNLAGVNPRNYAGTPFASTGLSYSTFSSLRSQGFGETNIVHAAQDAHQNGCTAARF
jgi:hypothetical protein